jgi:hypothetical protein
MPCSCGGMRRSGLAPSNIAIKQKQPITNVQQLYTPPPTQRPPQEAQIQSQTQTQTIPFQSNRPNFSGNLPSIRRK